MDPLVFWNKLQEMNYDDIIHWIEAEEVKGVPKIHDSCLLAELGKKVTRDNWSFADNVYSGGLSVFMGEVTKSMARVMDKFDKGFLEEFVREDHRVI